MTDNDEATFVVIFCADAVDTWTRGCRAGRGARGGVSVFVV